MKTKEWARVALTAAALLMLTGCSSLFGPSNEEEAAAMSEAVKSSSADIRDVKVGRGGDGPSKYVAINATMAGDQVTADQIDVMLAAAATVLPDGTDSLYLDTWQQDGAARIPISVQALDLGVPEEYVFDEYTLVAPVEWLQQEYGDAP